MLTCRIIEMGNPALKRTKKELKQFYDTSAKKVEVVDVPQMNFLMIDGEGDPNTSQAFQDAVEALFSVSYTLKFMIKKKARKQLIMASCHWRGYGGQTTCHNLALKIKIIGNGKKTRGIGIYNPL